MGKNVYLSEIKWTVVKEKLSGELTTKEDIMLEVRSQKAEGGQIKRLVKVPEFNVYHVQAISGFELKAMNRFRAVTILNGEGSIGTLDVGAGDHLILTTSTSYRIEGDLEWIMSDVPLPPSI